MGKQNLAKGREAKARKRAEAKAAGLPTAGARWAMLLDGTLTVSDLDDEEIRRGRVRGADGGFTGRRHSVPSHLMAEFQKELLRRAESKFKESVVDAIELYSKVVNDEDAKYSDRLKAADKIIERVFGKTPETIRIEGADKFESVIGDALFVDRDMADGVGGSGPEDA
jgi:hypothetical protein